MRVYSPALKHQMKDCILAVLWPKRDIFKLFKDCSIPVAALRKIEDWEAKGLSRAAMVDQVFDTLKNQPDNGTLHFNILLELLSSWSYFDDYWFKNQQTLNLEEAKRKVAALKSAKSDVIDVAKKRADDDRARTAAREARHKSLEEMRRDFQLVAVSKKTPQARGYALEEFLGKMARYFGLQVTGPFRIKGTQIDGTIKYEGENYNIEAKWEHRSLSDEPLLAFCHKLEITMHGRGIYFSVNGYTPGTLWMLERSGVKNTVLFDGEDITLILNELITLPQALDAKIHAAQTGGKFYIHPITRGSKIQS